MGTRSAHIGIVPKLSDAELITLAVIQALPDHSSPTTTDPLEPIL
ncbi:hypothetical protein [Ilumatobacter sp.]